MHSWMYTNSIGHDLSSAMIVLLLWLRWDPVRDSDPHQQPCLAITYRLDERGHALAVLGTEARNSPGLEPDSQHSKIVVQADSPLQIDLDAVFSFRVLGLKVVATEHQPELLRPVVKTHPYRPAGSWMSCSWCLLLQDSVFTTL